MSMLLAAGTSAYDSMGLVNAAAWTVFAVGAALILLGAFGVVLLRNPVHCALMLVVTLFGVALEFVNEAADFLAAVQIIVYAGAIVIVFLFVIMLLGVDRKDALGPERFKVQVPFGILIAIAVVAEVVTLARVQYWTSGAKSVSAALSTPGEDVQKLGQSVFTRYLLPFEMTSALLVIAVVAAVVLARRQELSAGEMTADQQRQVRAK